VSFPIKTNYIKQSIFFIGLFICLSFYALGQNIDSLKSAVSNGKEDTVKINLLNKLSYIYLNDGNYPVALRFANQAQDLAEKLSFKSGLFNSLLNTGKIYFNRGDYTDAQKYYLLSLKLAEQINDNKRKAGVYNELGLFYSSLGKDEEAKKQYDACLKIRIDLQDKKGIASCYTNLGTIFADEGDYFKALFYYGKSLQIAEEIDNKEEMAFVYNNVGSVYYETKEYQKALDYFFKSLAIHEALGNTDNVASCYINIGDVYRLQNKYVLADQYLKKGIQLSEQIGSKEYTVEGYKIYYKLDSLKGDYKSVFEKYKTYILYRDSLNNADITKKTTEAQMNYDFEKKEASVKADQEKKDAIAATESRRQRLILWLITIVGIGITIVAFLIFRSLQQNKKATAIIEEQKEEVEHKSKLLSEKNREISDSINYAKRIQSSILPPLEEIYRALPNSFVLFKSKDIVSGDFYWFAHKENKIVIAAADCTGHGVPGAFMSMLNSEKLNEVVEKTTDVSEILQLVNTGLKKALRQSNDENSTRDGMDIALCSFNREMTYLDYAAANRPLWIIRNKKTEIEEIKATKTAIGGYTDDSHVFKKHRVDLQKGDTIYIFSDGYADQFGVNNKKLMTKKFKEILLSINDKSMPEQRNYLDEFIENWKSGMEQTDDILVIGIRV
jgi:serine phosphatase RsbU (regulator of sigma subunit)/Tfp pilus assembly protein PilF